MPMSLRITSYQRLTPGQQGEFHPASDSFTIGRSTENDWSIPDPQLLMSGVHCRIERRGSEYYLTDLSTNGVFMNGSSKRVPRNNTVQLSPGDRFIIGDYEIEVSLSEPRPEPGLDSATEAVDLFDLGGNDPFASAPAPAPEEDDGDPFATPAPARAAPAEDDDFLKDPNAPLSHLDDSALGTGVDIDSIIDLDEPARPKAPEPRREAAPPPIHDTFMPPRQAAPAAPPGSASDWDEIPDNWDEATGMFRAPAAAQPASPAAQDDDEFDIPDDWDAATGLHRVQAAAPTPAPSRAEPPPPAPKPAAKPVPEPAPQTPAPAAAPAASAPAAGGGSALAAFERGAGLKPGQLSSVDAQALFDQLGSMIRACTEGLMKTLSGRAHIKSEFRLDQTMIRPVENNPLKFSPLVEDAMARLLRQSDQAYMSGTRAIREGFDDINAHQMAVVAGMEAALQGILRKFDPKALEKKLVSSSFLDNVLPGAKKAKYWDTFVLLYSEIASDAEDDFQQLFGREFARAYEAQLERLKNERRE